MALQRDARYPGRWTAASSGHPQGAFKNRTAPGSLDGSYIEQDWANDWDGFFSSLLNAASITPSGNVDAVGASDYYNAFQSLVNTKLPFRGQTLINTAGVSTWTVPAGVTRAFIYVTGGGGGGGGSTSPTGAAGGGGGAGATGVKLLSLTGVTSVTVTIGGGGAGGGAGATGSPGVATSFGSFISASGGLPGSGSGGGATISGGGATTATGADMTVDGGAGRYSFVVNGSIAAGGIGGDSFFGRGSAAPNASGTTTAGFNGAVGRQGAGGSGGVSYNASASGGAGGPGCVFILY